MVRIVSGILLGSLIITSLASAESVDVEGIVARNLGAVVLITGTRKDTGAPVQGSGCVVHADGFVLATAHQTDGVEGFVAKFADGATMPLTVVDVEPAIEYALLKTDAPPSVVATVGDAAALGGGAPLISIASPVNLEFTTVTGTVANPNKTYNGYPVLLASLTASHGSSGGPVFDRNGRLVGLISGGLNEVDFTIVNKINNAYPMLQRRGLMGGAAHDAPVEDVLVPADGVTEAERRAVEAYNRGVQAPTPDAKVEAYGLALTLLPAFYEASFNLAVAHYRGGDLEQAISAYRKAEALRPDAVEVQRNLGRAYLKLEEYDQAVAVFERARALAPQDAQSHNDLGEAYRRAGRLDEAIGAFEASLALDNRAPGVHFNLALAYAANKQPAEAIRHFEAYLALAPKARDAERVRALIRKLRAP